MWKLIRVRAQKVGIKSSPFSGVDRVQVQCSGSEFSKASMKFLSRFSGCYVIKCHINPSLTNEKHGPSTFELLQRKRLYVHWSYLSYALRGWMNKRLSLLLDKASCVFKINRKRWIYGHLLASSVWIAREQLLCYVFSTFKREITDWII